MAVTRSWEQRAVVQIGAWERVVPVERRRELPWLIGASVLVCAGLAAVLFAKTLNFADSSARLSQGELLNLNAVTKPDELLPALQIFPDAVERQLVAERIAKYIQSHRPLPNVGALARLRVSQKEIETRPEWHTLRDQLQQQMARSQAHLRNVRTSTHQDSERGKPLEFEALSGAVVRAAQRHGIGYRTWRRSTL